MLPSNFVEVCRLCLIKDEVEVNIFENGSKEIYYRISTCLPVTITLDDKLPKKICISCLNKVNMIYDFWNQTLDAEKHLLSWLNSESHLSNSFEKPPQTCSFSAISETRDGSTNNHHTGLDSDENNVESDLESNVERCGNNVISKECDESDIPKSNQVLSVDYQDDKPGPSGFQVEQTSALKQLQGKKAKQRDSICDPSNQKTESTDNINENQIKTLKVKLGHKYAPTHNGKDPIKKIKIQFKLNKEALKCKHCDMKFNSNAECKKHENRVHSTSKISKNSIKYECDRCNYSTYTKGCFTTHLKRHIKQYTSFCEECNVGFFNNTEHTSHDIKFHEMQPFQCALCNDLFTSKGNLYSHIKSHDPNNSYVCEICGRTYKKNNSYKRHISRTHLGLNTKAQCMVCQKVLSSKEHLRRHMLTHTDERNWVCATCGKCFLSKTYLTEHSRIHLGIRPYKCEICEKCFTQRGSLTIHKRSHTGERPFRCEYCNKGFVMSTLLRYHLKKCGEAKLNSHSIINTTAPVPHVGIDSSLIFNTKLEPTNIVEPADIDPLNNCAVIHSTS